MLSPVPRARLLVIRIFVTRVPLRTVQVLVIQLMRWRNTEDGEKQAVVHAILLDAELKVGKAVYSLVAVVRMHQGALHYTTLAKRRGRGSRLKWWKYNDDVVAGVDHRRGGSSGRALCLRSILH